MKKQLLLKVCALASISIAMFGCKKEVSTSKSTLSTSNSNVAASTLTTTNVYVSGFYLYTTTPLARFWVNTATPFNLTTGTGTYAQTSDIDVSSTGDVFTIGRNGPSVSSTPGVVWKNTNPSVNLPLPAGATSADPRMVYADGSTIYIVGITWFSGGSDHRATLWTIPLGNTSLISTTVLGGSYSDAFGVTVTNTGDVYVAGNVSTSGGAAQGTLVYWKNGVQTTLPGSVQGTRVQILSIGNDVYIAYGQTSGGSSSMLLFKNGAVYSPGLTGGPTVSISSWGLATDGTNLFIEAAGTNNPSASQVTIWIWENSGAPIQTISNSGTSTFGTTFNCFSVTPNGDTYVTGTESFIGCYWKNGVKTNLFGGTNNNISGISVK